MSNDQSKCPGHDRPECVSCCWPKAEDLKPQYTAVDMTTAAADGFRDGQASVVVENPIAEELYGIYSRDVVRMVSEEWINAIISAGGKVK